MGVYDQAARFAAQADPEPVVSRVLAPAGEPSRFHAWQDTRAIPFPGGPDRTADLVAALDNPGATDQPALLILEFQAQHDPDKLDVTLEEAAILRNHARHGDDGQGKYRVLTGLVYLRGRCPENVLDMTLAGGYGTRHAALVWDVAADDAPAALEAVSAGRASWGLLFWVPLMAGAGEEAVVSRWKEVVAAVVADGRTRSNLAGIAWVFAELAGCYLTWERGLEGWEMTESQVVNRWVNKGELEGARRFLTLAVREKFGGAVSGDVLEAISRQPSMSLLEDWLKAVFAADTLQDFIAVLRR